MRGFTILCPKGARIWEGSITERAIIPPNPPQIWGFLRVMVWVVASRTRILCSEPLRIAADRLRRQYHRPPPVCHPGSKARGRRPRSGWDWVAPAKGRPRLMRGDCYQFSQFRWYDVGHIRHQCVGRCACTRYFPQTCGRESCRDDARAGSCFTGVVGGCTCVGYISIPVRRNDANCLRTTDHGTGTAWTTKVRTLYSVSLLPKPQSGPWS